jgi:uncharacterized protein with PQ loop repeat
MRVFAYVPQIVRIRHDQQGASAISYTTWGLFLISNLSTVAYGLLVVNDWRLVAVFAANTICCVAVLGLTAWKRAVFKAARQLASASSGSPRPVQDTVTRADRDIIQMPVERPSGHARPLGEESILGYLVEARQHRLFRSELPICSKSRHHVHRRCAVLGRSAEEPNRDCGEYELQSVLCSLRYALPTAATFS